MRNLTDEDIKALAKEFRSDHNCRYDIEPHDLEESVKFYKNLNRLFELSWKTVWKAFLSSTVIALLIIIGLGILARVRQHLGI